MVRGKICQWRKLEQASNIEMDSIRSDWKIETGEENRETPDSAKIKRGKLYTRDPKTDFPLRLKKDYNRSTEVTILPPSFD
jgi:hypothetical protein